MINGNRGFLEAPFLYDEIKKVVVQLGIFKLGEDCNRVTLYPYFFHNGGRRVGRLDA